jgi:diguanylate cyclase (GGDEF)-like protein/PAS domain S-box-containing protein
MPVRCLGRVVACNEAYLDIYNLSPAVVKPGCTLLELLKHRKEVGLLLEDPERYADTILASVARKRITTWLIETRDGRYIQAKNHPFRDGGGWITTHEDVTDRRRAELEAQVARVQAEQAKAEVQAAHRQLLEAFEVVPEGVALFDAEDRLVRWNKRYEEIYPATRFRAGMRFEDLIRDGIARGQYPAAVGREAEYLAERLRLHNEPRSSLEQELPGGRWVRVEEQRTADGGHVGVRIDITDLKQRERSFRLLFEHNPVPMWVFECKHLRFLAVNDAAIKHYEYSREQFMAMSTLDIRPPEDRDEYRLAVASGSHSDRRVWQHIKADGTRIDVTVFSSQLTYEGQPALLVAVADVTERNRAEARVRAAQEFLDTIVENIPVSIVAKRADDFRYVLINRAYEELLGVSREAMLGRTPSQIFSEQVGKAIALHDHEALANPGASRFDEVVFDTPRGPRQIKRRRVVLRENNAPKYIVGVLEDITDRKEAPARIAHLQEHDPLTDLPFGGVFRQRLEAAIEKARNKGSPLAILRLNLDRFKDTNDAFGEECGDAVLREVADRLRKEAAGAYLARGGGDEFTLISEGPQPRSAEALARRIQHAVNRRIRAGGKLIPTGVSIGIAIFPADGGDAATLTANADAALHRAKVDGRGTVRFFDRDTDAALRERRALQNDLRLGIPQQLILHYQPQMRINRELIGFEALVRWRHPSRGMIAPDTFIPAAEDSGLIFALDAWVLREACGQAAAWPTPLQIAVNLSPLQFRRGDLVGLVRSTLADTALGANRLELEITESVLIDDFERASAILGGLKSLGVRIALDDFGTGFSSLSYLQSFPFDKIKIDRSFVSNLPSNVQSASIVRSIIALGHGFKVPILAEGVETEEQFAFLAAEACDEAQGYLLGRPAPLQDYADLMNQRRASVVPAKRARTGKPRARRIRE